MIPKIEGGGLLFKNDKKKEGDRTPDYRSIGEAKLSIYLPDQMIEVPISLAMWKKTAKNGNIFLSLQIKNSTNSKEAEVKEPAKEEIPF